MSEMFGGFLAAEVFKWIGPEQVTHRTKRRRLLESVQLDIQIEPHTAVNLAAFNGSGLYRVAQKTGPSYLIANILKTP